jgi:hypothetical protein
MIMNLSNLAKGSFAAAVVLLPTAALADRYETVRPRAPIVTLSDVGKEVKPGYVQVNPKSLSGRRFVLTDHGGSMVNKKICIGIWDPNGGCKGIYIEKPDPKSPK